MKILMILLAAFLMAAPFAFAQNALNNAADNILGKYESVQGGDRFRAEISKRADGTYHCQIYWIENPIDAKTGKKALDVKNPDKSLRSVPCDEVVLFHGLKYNAAKKQWDGTKIYDPQRGIRANVTVKFLEDGRLCLRGTILGIGEKAYWTKL